jgi:hypothetical protein
MLVLVSLIALSLGAASQVILLAAAVWVAKHLWEGGDAAGAVLQIACLHAETV